MFDFLCRRRPIALAEALGFAVGVPYSQPTFFRLYQYSLFGGLVVCQNWQQIFNLVDPEIAGFYEFAPVPHFRFSRDERPSCIVKIELDNPDPVRGATYDPARPMTLTGATESDDIKFRVTVSLTPDDNEPGARRYGDKETVFGISIEQ